MSIKKFLGYSETTKQYNSDEETEPLEKQASIFNFFKNETYDVQRIYWDADGNLRHGTSKRDRDLEVLNLIQIDSVDESDPGKLW